MTGTTLWYDNQDDSFLCDASEPDLSIRVAISASWDSPDNKLGPRPLRHRHDCYPERDIVNYQEIIQEISDGCEVEYSIVDEIIRAFLALAADQFQDMRRPPPRVTRDSKSEIEAEMISG